MQILIDTKAGSFTITDLPAVVVPWGYCQHLPANMLKDRIETEFNNFWEALDRALVKE